MSAAPLYQEFGEHWHVTVEDQAIGTRIAPSGEREVEREPQLLAQCVDADGPAYLAPDDALRFADALRHGAEIVRRLA